MKLPDITTYQAAILQSKAHRALKAHMADALREYGLTMMQWTIIGLIAEAGGEGRRISDLARQLDTSLAFITTSVNVLEAKGAVERASHIHDNRAKIVLLTPSFAAKVAEIEAEVGRRMREHVYSSLEPTDLTAYFRVLDFLAKN